MVVHERRDETGDAPPMPEVVFGEDEVAFRRYPYAPARVYPDGALRATSIRELVPNFRPPVLRTTEDDFLVIPEDALDEARAFCARNGIPVVRRLDVWALLLEPFMDAPIDREGRKRIMAWLARAGLSRARVWWLRWRISFRVEFLHCLHWSWQHYGLADVLDATQPLRSRRGFSRFYRHAMRVAALGPALAEDEPDPAEPLRVGPRVIEGIDEAPPRGAPLTRP